MTEPSTAHDPACPAIVKRGGAVQGAGDLCASGGRGIVGDPGRHAVVDGDRLLGPVELADVTRLLFGASVSTAVRPASTGELIAPVAWMAVAGQGERSP